MRNRRWSWPLRATSIKPVGKPPSRGSGSEMAQQSKKFQIEVLRSSMAFLRANTSGGAISSMVGATIGVVGNASTSISAKPRIHLGDQRGALVHHLDVVGRADVARPLQPRAHVRIDVGAAPVEPVAMQGEGFRRLHAATAVDPRHAVEQRQLLVGQPRARLLQPVERVRETFAHGVVQIFQRQALRDADAQIRERRRLERLEVVARHHRVGLGAVHDGPRDRPDRVDALRQRKGAGGGNALPARLEADEAAERAGNAGGAAGVAADGDLAHAVGDRHGGARRRAAGNALAIGRIARRAVMRIDADAGKGEFGHVGLGDDDRAAGAQGAHHRRIGVGRLALLGQNLRAGARDFAGDVEQILDGDDGAVERAERDAGAGARIGGVGGTARGLAINGKAGAHALAAQVVDAHECGLEPFPDGNSSHAFNPPFCSMNRAISPTLVVGPNMSA